MTNTSEVLVVARTRMSGAKVCIGALSKDGASLRLMNSACASELAQQSPYKIGEWWRVTYAPCGNQRPPHLEDVAVSARERIGEQDNMSSYLLSKTKPWKGKIDVLFDGKISFTKNGAGYISPSAVPAHATGFWVPSTALDLETDAQEKLGYYPLNDHRHLSYVGTQDALPRIKAGQLVRVSLARWWKPRDADPSFEERCYVQLSGWY